MVVDPKGQSSDCWSITLLAQRSEDGQFPVDIRNELTMQVCEHCAKMGWYKGDRKCQGGQCYNLTRMG